MIQSEMAKGWVDASPWSSLLAGGNSARRGPNNSKATVTVVPIAGSGSGQGLGEPTSRLGRAHMGYRQGGLQSETPCVRTDGLGLHQFRPRERGDAG